MDTKTVIKLLDHFQYIRDQKQVFTDAVEFVALNVALISDPHKKESRKERCKEILDSYDGRDYTKFIEICTAVNELMKGMIECFDDYLGEIYMNLPGNKSQAGQFFTPYHVSLMVAKMTFGTIPETGKVLTINEPACGSGGMVIAAAQTFDELGFNYTDNALVVANDVDRNCALMSYLQISYTGMPAVVKHQNSLTQETWDEFITPAFALQYPKFKRAYEGLSKDGPSM